MIGSLLLLIGCLIDPPPTRNCEERVAFYPDDDGNGLGEPSAVYLGCDAPDGWVTELDPALVDTDTDTDTGTDPHTAETGGSTADTGVAGGTAHTGASVTADTGP